MFRCDYKNTNAAKSALQINWMLCNLLRPKFEAKYGKLRDGTFTLSHSTGVDTSDELSCALASATTTICSGLARPRMSLPNSVESERLITPPTFQGSVYDVLAKEAKTSTDGRAVWEERKWTGRPIERIFQSDWARRQTADSSSQSVVYRRDL